MREEFSKIKFLHSLPVNVQMPSNDGIALVRYVYAFYPHTLRMQDVVEIYCKHGMQMFVNMRLAAEKNEKERRKKECNHT